MRLLGIPENADFFVNSGFCVFYLWLLIRYTL